MLEVWINLAGHQQKQLLESGKNAEIVSRVIALRPQATHHYQSIECRFQLLQMQMYTIEIRLIHC